MIRAQQVENSGRRINNNADYKTAVPPRRPNVRSQLLFFVALACLLRSSVAGPARSVRHRLAVSLVFTILLVTILVYSRVLFLNLTPSGQVFPHQPGGVLFW